jgi:hypothetical protein
LRVAQSDLRRIERAAERLANARAEWEAAIVAAWKSGEVYRDIARAARVSHQRIGQIVKEAKK